MTSLQFVYPVNVTEVVRIRVDLNSCQFQPLMPYPEGYILLKRPQQHAHAHASILFNSFRLEFIFGNIALDLYLNFPIIYENWEGEDNQ